MPKPNDRERKDHRPGKEEPSEGQYGGLHGGLGYGAGRDPKRMERPAEDLDLDADKEEERKR